MSFLTFVPGRMPRCSYGARNEATSHISDQSVHRRHSFAVIARVSSKSLLGKHKPYLFGFFRLLLLSST